VIRARHIALTLVSLLAAALHLSAHDLERTQVSLSFSSDGSFVLDVANDPNWLLLRLARFSQVALDDARGRDDRLSDLATVFIDRVVLFVDGHEVRPKSAQYIPPPHSTADDLPPLAVYRMRGRMPAQARTLRWFYGLVIDPYPITLRRPDGVSRTEWVAGDAWSGNLDLSNSSSAMSRLQVARQYLALGYTHILPKGLDHILFVLGLFLLSLRLKPILLQVTTFTVAHSITLGLTMYGVVSLPSRVVEPLIALSIACVAIENVMTTELKPWRLALVFSFGLLHGMGFAGVLRELGLPRSEFLTALLTFNLGVEAGQLTVIGIAGLLVIGFRRRDWYHRRLVVPASLAIATVGVYWTIIRVAGR
jgi:hypothetical protein